VNLVMDKVINSVTLTHSKTYTFGPKYDGVRKLSEEPFVGVIENLISPIECEYLINKAHGNLKRAGVVLDKLNGISEGRTGSNCWFRFDGDDETVRSIKQMTNEEIRAMLKLFEQEINKHKRLREGNK
jgi:hypothetical protein